MAKAFYSYQKMVAYFFNIAFMEWRYTDADLTLLIKHNDRKAFDYIYACYTPLQKRIIKKMDIVEPAANTILRRIFYDPWMGIHQYDPQTQPLYLWMHNMTREKAWQYIRNKATSAAGSYSSINEGKQPSPILFS